MQRHSLPRQVLGPSNLCIAHIAWLGLICSLEGISM